MTIKVADGSLFVPSPVRLDPETRDNLDQIGDVRFVIALNRFHHFFAGEYSRLYPEAWLFGAPGLDS